MNLFKRLGAALMSAMVHPASSGWWGNLLYNLRGTRFNYAGKVGDGQDSSVVMAPVMWIAKNAVQAVPEVLKEVDGLPEKQIKHPLTELLRKPNNAYTGKQLTIGTIISLLTSVDAYWIKVRDNRGQVAELWLAPSNLIEPMNFPGNEGASFIDYYSYQPGQGEIRLDPIDVVHFRNGINPRDVRHGISLLYPILREVYSDTEAANFTGALLANMGIPGVIISPKDKEAGMTEPEAKAVKSKFMETFGGDKRGEVMVGTVGVNVEQFGFNPDELVLDKLRNISEERACAMFGVAAAVVGFGTGIQQTKVGATLIELRRSSWEDGIIPNLDIIADTLADSLLPDFEQDPEAFTVSHDLTGIRALRESEDAKFKRANTGVNGGWLRVDQAQAMAGIEPDETQRVYLRRGNLIEVPAGQELEGKAISRGGSSLLLKAHRAKARPTMLQARLMSQYGRDERRLMKEFERVLIEFLDEMAGIIADTAQDVLELKAFGETQLIFERIDLEALEAKLKVIFESHYGATGASVLSAVNNVMGVTIGAPDLVAQRIVAMGGRRAGLVDLSESTRRRLFRILTEAEAAGLGVDEVVRQIRGTVTAGPWSSVEIRARIIARTETLHAQRESMLATYRQMADVDSVMVFDARLGETDEDCEALDGTIVTLSEADILSIEEHPNGTRAFAPVI